MRLSADIRRALHDALGASPGPRARVAALAVVLVGGSLFVFLVKGGTVGVLVRGERHAGAIERPPLMPETLARASAFSI